MLHHISDEQHNSLLNVSITSAKFTAFLNTIEEKGLESTTFEEISNSAHENPLKNKIVLTFDDCPSSLFDFVIPELIKRKMKAVFFIPAAYIGGVNTWDIIEHEAIAVPLMNPSQLEELSKHGMEIGSHGYTHANLKKMSCQQASEEVVSSKQVLETLLNKKIISFAYPYGCIPKGYKKILNNAGFQYGAGIYSSRQERYALRRFQIHQSDNGKSMRFKLSKRYMLFRSLLDPLLVFRKKIFS